MSPSKRVKTLPSPPVLPEFRMNSIFKPEIILMERPHFFLLLHPPQPLNLMTHSVVLFFFVHGLFMAIQNNNKKKINKIFRKWLKGAAGCWLDSIWQRARFQRKLGETTWTNIAIGLINSSQFMTTFEYILTDRNFRQLQPIPEWPNIR